MTVARRTRIVRACNLSGGSTRGVAINHTRRSTLPSQRASPMARRGSTVTGPPEPGRTSPSDVGQNHGQGARTGRARATPAHLATKHFANATPAPTSHGPPTRVQHSAQLPTGHHAHGARDRAPHPLGPRVLCAGRYTRSHEARTEQSAVQPHPPRRRPRDIDSGRSPFGAAAPAAASVGAHKCTRACVQTLTSSHQRLRHWGRGSGYNHLYASVTTHGMGMCARGHAPSRTDDADRQPSTGGSKHAHR